MPGLAEDHSVQARDLSREGGVTVIPISLIRKLSPREEQHTAVGELVWPTDATAWVVAVSQVSSQEIITLSSTGRPSGLSGV